MSLIVPGTAREDSTRKPMIGTPRPPVTLSYTGGPISGRRGQARIGEMGQHWESEGTRMRMGQEVTVMTVILETVQLW